MYRHCAGVMYQACADYDLTMYTDFVKIISQDYVHTLYLFTPIMYRLIIVHVPFRYILHTYIHLNFLSKFTIFKKFFKIILLCLHVFKHLINCAQYNTHVCICLFTFAKLYRLIQEFLNSGRGGGPHLKENFLLEGQPLGPLGY